MKQILLLSLLLTGCGTTLPSAIETPDIVIVNAPDATPDDVEPDPTPTVTPTVTPSPTPVPTILVTLQWQEPDTVGQCYHNTLKTCAATKTLPASSYTSLFTTYNNCSWTSPQARTYVIQCSDCTQFAATCQLNTTYNQKTCNPPPLVTTCGFWFP